MGQNQSSDSNGSRRGDEGGGALPRRCYYDVIGVEPLATNEELYPTYLSCCSSM